jgi:hypothetical protein
MARLGLVLLGKKEEITSLLGGALKDEGEPLAEPLHHRDGDSLQLLRRQAP